MPASPEKIYSAYARAYALVLSGGEITDAFFGNFSELEEHVAVAFGVRDAKSSNRVTWGFKSQVVSWVEAALTREDRRAE